MQTRLQIPGLLVLASLLWTSPTSVASQIAKAHTATKNYKLRYVGTASWYGKQHQGRKMANGESVLVTITARGPNLRLHRILRSVRSSSRAIGLCWTGPSVGILLPRGFI